MKKIVEVTLRFMTWEADNTKILSGVVDMATELRRNDSSMDVVNVAIEAEDDDDDA